ncbi:MAG: C-terminal processing peptidase-3 [Bacteroidetes bacterium]|jgi:carboxyl-terminal processing protease|nr:C-terminal processing peptidase-3 [Bacteroidota bacterium]
MIRFRKFYLLIISLIVVSVWVLAQQDANERRFSMSKNLDVFNSVVRELDAFYVDTLNYEKVIRSGIDNMLDGLDPYTVYMPKEETDELKMMTTGEYAGIGALIGGKSGQVFISEPYEGKPAAKAGLKAGDVVVELDGLNLKGKSTSDVSALLKGQPKTIVKLKIQRPGETKVRSFEIMRERIVINPVVYYGVVGNNTGYVLLNEFTSNAAEEMRVALLELKNKYHVTSMVIDLRENGGGIIDEAVKMVGYFVPKGTEVVSTRGKLKQWDRTYRTINEPILPDMPLAILVSQNTASASEILSGSLQDLDRAVIVGVRTFGKGLVQQIRQLPYEGHLKVTIAKYYIPSGRCIQAIDYSNRTNDGNPIHVADSLTHEFKTKIGRTVRDGGGIRPDVEVRDSMKMSIVYYLISQNVIFDFATQYAQTHATIAEPEKFKITDAEYDQFKQFVKSKKFTYTLQSDKLLKNLMATAKMEGYDEATAADFKALQSKLIPNIDKDLETFQKDISNLINAEIIKRYYYQKGVVRYALPQDKVLLKTEELFRNMSAFNKILGK